MPASVVGQPLSSLPSKLMKGCAVADKSSQKTNSKKKATRTLKEKRAAKKQKNDGQTSLIPPTGR